MYINFIGEHYFLIALYLANSLILISPAWTEHPFYVATIDHLWFYMFL